MIGALRGNGEIWPSERHQEGFSEEVMLELRAKWWVTNRKGECYES